jgi:fatty-acyl-CoA synthase
VALEAHLAGHPGVREAAVVAVDDAKWQERPAAIIVPNGEPPSIDSLKAHVAAAFPKFWVPDRWIFMEALPRTSVGKFDKKALREDFRAHGNQPQ